MADGYFERGEVYWCRIDHNVGGEMGVTRPAVVVSKDENNNRLDSVTVAWLTTRPKEGAGYVNTLATGRESWIIAQQLYTVDKSRFQKWMGRLSYGEMRELDAALEDSLDLGYNDNQIIAEKEREVRQRDGVIQKLEQQIMELERQLKSQEELYHKLVSSQTVETEKVNRLYFAALDQLVAMQLERDRTELVNKRRIAVIQNDRAALRSELGLPPAPNTGIPTVVEEENAIKPVSEPPVEKTPVAETPNPPKPPVPPAPKPKYGDDMVNLNDCTLTRLKKLGFTMALAREIVAHRPYKNVEELLKVPGLKKTMYNIAKPKLYCLTPEEPKKETQFEADPGYEEDPEPPMVPTLDDGNEMVAAVEVVEEVEEITPPVEEKINVNTATAREMMDKLGMRREYAFSITGFRKKHGRYLTLDELLLAPRVGNRFMELYRDKLEV